MHRIKLKKNDLDVSSNRRDYIFDSVINLLCSYEYEELSPNQQIAQLLLFYDNEVNNGGHLQYFHNQGLDKLDEVSNALEIVGAKCQLKIFEEASKKGLETPVSPVSSLEEYYELSLEQDFEELDMAFYNCHPNLGDELLPAFVEKNINDFVIIEEMQ